MAPLVALTSTILHHDRPLCFRPPIAASPSLSQSRVHATCNSSGLLPRDIQIIWLHHHESACTASAACSLCLIINHAE